MTRRQRFLETMTFGSPDRPAAGDYFSYEATRQRWEREGLPAGVDLVSHFGMDFDPFVWRATPAIMLLPRIEEEVLEETEQYRVVRQGYGETVRILKDVPPPAMPQWISYALQSRADWEAFRERLGTNHEELYGTELARQAAESATRDYPLGLWVGSSYGYLRDLWGVSALSYLFYDDPALIEEMIEVLTAVSVSYFDHVLASGVELDWVMFWEDMAFKNGPLVSPELYRRYCLPLLAAVMERVQAAGIPVAMLDSDGDVRRLIPLWLDLGITIMHPLEVASGMDIREERKKYGRGIGFYGGIDKRALAGPREALEAEVVPKLRVGFEAGGFIPACDHAIPPDVSLDNYRYFRELVDQVAEEMYGG